MSSSSADRPVETANTARLILSLNFYQLEKPSIDIMEEVGFLYVCFVLAYLCEVFILSIRYFSVFSLL